jgi:insecticidal toxin complex protein TccC
VIERALDGEAVCTERLSYGASDQASAEHNQCGQLIRHDDPAGTQLFTEFGLHGTALEQMRHFLKDLALPDWPEPIADRELLLEPGEGAATRSHFNAVGEVAHQTDAKGHRQRLQQTLDGQLRAVHLQLNGASTAKTLLSAITYNAHGQTEREVAGNGVITTLEYDAQNGRLTRLQARRDNENLQDLLYAYDPVGNVLSIEDAALPIRYFANQRIEPVNRYAYDSLSQLIEATGWEAGSSNKGPQFSAVDDSNPRANYRQTFRYDAGNNLLELTHEGPQSHGHRLVAAAHSNRCLPVLAGVEPGEEHFRQGFDSNGNLLNLQPGQSLAWDLRNQLSEVRPVVRDSGIDDIERYIYGADGMRLRKVREAHTNARVLIAETRYLPNLELRNYNGTGEVLQVISVQTGRSSVRALHWESEPPKDMGKDQYRYHLNDHLGSCTLELDDDGEVISQERYHPFGTTAWFAGRGEVEASYKTARYSGKERDATGLYYYGFRYYVPWLQRWLNPDPAGEVGGFNLYVMVINNPVNRVDPDGLKPLLFGVKREVETARKNSISYSEAAIEILKSGDSSLVQSVMLKYFNDASSERISRWVNDLLKVIDVAKMTKIHRNLELIDDDYEGGIYKKSVAMVDGKKYSDFKVYSDSIFRTIRNFSDNKKELAEQLKDKKNQYKAQRNKKFLLVNQKNWNVFKELGGEAMLVSAAIHEFSHVAVGTQDYVYKRILEGKNNTPLFDLAAGQPSADSRLPALTRLISETGRNLNYSDVAYSNADSFAEATVALVKTFGGVKRLKSGKGNSIAPRAYK